MANDLMWFDTIVDGLVKAAASVLPQPLPGAAVALGYRAPGDGGGGLFYWDGASDAPPDAGLVFAAEPARGHGRWIRLNSLQSLSGSTAQIPNGPLNVRWFGARGNGTADDTNAVQSAINATNGATVFFPAGD